MDLTNPTNATHGGPCYNDTHFPSTKLAGDQPPPPAALFDAVSFLDSMLVGHKDSTTVIIAPEKSETDSGMDRILVSTITISSDVSEIVGSFCSMDTLPPETGISGDLPLCHKE